MNEQEKIAFNKGIKYAEMYAEKVAEEKYECIVICLLERCMRGEGEMFIPDLDIQLARRRFVSSQKRDYENKGYMFKLIKEIQ